MASPSRPPRKAAWRSAGRRGRGASPSPACLPQRSRCGSRSSPAAVARWARCSSPRLRRAPRCWAAAGRALRRGDRRRPDRPAQQTLPTALVAILWLFAVVWLTDIGAYFAAAPSAAPSCGRASAPRRRGPASSAASLAGTLRAVASCSGAHSSWAWLVLEAGPRDGCSSRWPRSCPQGGDLLESAHEAPVRRQGFQPSDPRPWRRDGPARFVLGGLRRCSAVFLYATGGPG